MKAALAELARGLADVAFPPSCVNCRGLVEGPAHGAHPLRHLCVECAGLLQRVQPPHCAACGHPFYGEVRVDDRLCPHCAGLAPAYGEGRTALLLKGPARALVHELKYHGGLHVARDMGEIFRTCAHVVDWVRDAVLVPVPLHPRKERERGFNQSALIAAELARVAGGATRVEMRLRRVVDTETQTHRDRKARRANLKNAFALARGGEFDPEQHLILVDDVFTTGSTLNSCALVLRRAGCLKLDVVTFGHG